MKLFAIAIALFAFLSYVQAIEARGTYYTYTYTYTTYKPAKTYYIYKDTTPT